MGCFSGRLMSAASDQKLFCKLCSPFCCSFDEFVEEKVWFIYFILWLILTKLSSKMLHQFVLLPVMYEVVCFLSSLLHFLKFLPAWMKKVYNFSLIFHFIYYKWGYVSFDKFKMDLFFFLYILSMSLYPFSTRLWAVRILLLEDFIYE